MQWLIGIVIGILVYHYYPSEIASVAETTAGIVHQGASKIADVTEPTMFEKAKQKVEEISK